MESLTRAGVALIAALAAGGPIDGTYALLGGTQQASAQLTVRPAGAQSHLAIVESNGQTHRRITAYGVEMTKTMHLIVISDDFSRFMHVHPALDARTGEFAITMTLDAARRYYAYADTTPKGLGQQVFRFSIGSNAPNDRPSPAMTPSPPSAHAGPYTVAFGTTQLRANAAASVPVTITKGGKPASDLHQYLGAAAHAVFIETTTLAYVHVHPTVAGESMDMDMPGMDMSTMESGAGKAGPKMSMHVPGLPAGTYKLWLQFRGGSTLYTVPVTMAAR